MTSNEMVYYLRHETNFDLSVMMEIANHIELQLKAILSAKTLNGYLVRRVDEARKAIKSQSTLIRDLEWCKIQLLTNKN